MEEKAKLLNHNSKAIVMFSLKDEDYIKPLACFNNAIEAAQYLKENGLANANTLDTSISGKVRGAANGEKTRNHIGSKKTSSRVSAFGFRWAFLASLPNDAQEEAKQLLKDLSK